MIPRVGALVVVAALLISGCETAGQRSGEPPASAPPSAASPSEPADDVRQEIEDLLATRAAALEKGRHRAFLRTVAPRDRRAQRADYAALSRFPVGKVTYRLGMHDPDVAGDRYHARVEMGVALRGFDPSPVPTEHQMEFVRRSGGWVVARDHADPAQLTSAPWLDHRIRLYVSPDLVIAFDRGSVDRRERVARLAEEALDRVRTVVPGRWRSRVVVLALSRTDALSYEGFNPAEIENVGGVAISAGPDPHASATRVLLAPAVLEADDRALGSLLAHELAHVALVDHDEFGIPVWVDEGIAEYASSQLDDQLFIARTAVEAARKGIDQMPPDGLFHRGDWGTSYGIAWFAMKVLARDHGEDAPYDLLRLLQRRDPRDFRAVSALLEKEYGLTTDQLARRSGELILETFG